VQNAVQVVAGVDLMLGIGGTPEGIITACAMKCLGGVIQGRLWPKDDEERQKATAERLERHAADVAEREQALARLGQTLLSRRGEDGVVVVPEAPAASFEEGLSALGAAARSKPPASSG
jgi:hypothetical protein